MLTKLGYVPIKAFICRVVIYSLPRLLNKNVLMGKQHCKIKNKIKFRCVCHTQLAAWFHLGTATF